MILFTMVDQSIDREVLGLVPWIFDDNDRRPAHQQIDERYAHGGGWFPIPGWSFNPQTMVLTYPGDKPYHPIAVATLPHTAEVLIFYPYSWLAIVQRDKSFEVMRLD
jgi:hypothetical protein